MFFKKINKEPQITKELGKFGLENKAIKKVDKIPMPRFWAGWSFGVGPGEYEYFYEIEYSQEGASKLLYCNLTTLFDVVITKVRFFAEIDGKVKEVY